MSHRAYAFNWQSFERDELHDILAAALESGDPRSIAEYIEAHREAVKDPYQGHPIAPDWQATLANRDVHEYGDFALTRFYNPADDRGIGEPWLQIDSTL